jgi:hypothetical protein
VSVGGKAPPAAACRESNDRAALIAAYREGLALTAIAAVRGPGGIRLTVMDEARGRSPIDATEMIDGVWWCRRSEHARRIAADATARLRRRGPGDGSSLPARSRADVVAVLAALVKRIGVPLYSDEEIRREAADVIARVDEEIENLQRAGQFKSVNKSYQTYRAESSARGEKVLPYARWLNEYKANLVRQLAAALRYS